MLKTMKSSTKWLLLVLLVIGALRSDAQQKSQTLTPQERDFAIKFLKETESGVFDKIKGLTKAQLAFKAAPDKWSVEDCVKHIASSETTLWAMGQEQLNQPSNPEKRADIKTTDQQLIAAVEDRAHKSKTFAALEPANAPFKDMDAALASFKENREKLINYLQNTKDDLRNHVAVLPVGTYDVYQFIMLISAHTDRHTQQMEEVIKDPNFPKA